jgi:hypothetical protein
VTIYIAIRAAQAVARIDRNHRPQPTRVPVRRGGQPVRMMSTRTCVLIAVSAVAGMLLVLALAAVMQ